MSDKLSARDEQGRGPWEILFGDEKGPLMGLVMSVVAEIGEDKFVELRAQLDSQEGTGPLLDPTFWSRTPKVWERSQWMKDLMSALARVAGLLERAKREGL